MENLSVAMRALGYFWKIGQFAHPILLLLLYLLLLLLLFIVIIIIIIIIIVIIIIIWREQCCQIETLVNLLDNIGT